MYFCESENKLFCIECKDCHANCTTKESVCFSRPHTISAKENYVAKLRRYEQYLDKCNKWLDAAIDKSRKKLATMGYYNTVRRRLKIVQFYEDTQHFEKDIKNSLLEIERKRDFLDLIEERTATHNLFVAVQKLKKEDEQLLDIKIDVLNNSIYRLEISNENEDFVITKIYMKDCEQNENQNTCDTQPKSPRLPDPDENKQAIEHLGIPIEQTIKQVNSVENIIELEELKTEQDPLLDHSVNKD